MDDFNPMWWLNDDSNDGSSCGSGENSAVNLLDELVDSEVRRCYSETNLLQFDSADVQAALVNPKAVAVLCQTALCHIIASY